MFELKIKKIVFEIWSVFEKYLQIQSNTHSNYQQKVKPDIKWPVRLVTLSDRVRYQSTCHLVNCVTAMLF